MLQLPLPTRDVYNIILEPLYIFTYFKDICHKQMLLYYYITFEQPSFKECVNYKQRLNSLQTALVCFISILTRTSPMGCTSCLESLCWQDVISLTVSWDPNKISMNVFRYI